MSSLTVREHAQQVRRRLYAGNNRTRYNFLTADVSASATTLFLGDSPKGMEESGTVAVGTELMYVRSVDTTAKAVTVIRGFAGSTASPHLEADLVEVAPRFWLGDVLDTMREEVASWPTELFQAITIDLSMATGTRAYDLTGEEGNVLWLLEASSDKTELAAWRSTDGSWGNLPAVLVQDQNRQTFPSGYAVQLRDCPSRAGTLRVTYARTFDLAELELGDDLTEDLGIPTSWYDILRFGVMWRMMSTREIGRTDPQASGEQRRDEAVPPGYLSQTATALMRIRNQRIADEALRLRARWPYRMP